MNDTVELLGKIITGDARRDAIHIAVAPAIAAEDLAPGWRVGFWSDGAAGRCEKTVGIVDPFLTVLVAKGQKFWLYLYPGSITSLRHEWTHPAFGAKPADKAASEKWLRDFAASEGIGYTSLMAAVPLWDTHGSFVGGQRIDGVEGFDIPKEFWGHYETVSGTTVPEDERREYFSCSC